MGMRKLTKFLTNSDAIYQEFYGKKCLCRSQGLVHQKIEGSISAGTSGSVMLPARVLEPLRSGSKGISLPGLSTQLVQPFVHGKKSKRLIHVVLHVQRMLEKTMEFEEQVFRRIPEQEGTKKNRRIF